MRTVRHRLLPSLVALLALVIAVPIAGAQEPEPEPVATILPGSTIARIDVGGMTEEQALATVRAQFAQPIVLTVGKKQHTVTGTQLRARYAIARAVDEALARTGVGNTPVGIEFNQKRLDRTVRRLLDRVGTQGSEPSWRIRPRPRIVPGKAGITASERKIRTQIVQALEDPSLRPGQDAIPLRKVRTTPTLANMGYVVTISKNDLKLRLWRPSRYRRGPPTHSGRAGWGSTVSRSASTARPTRVPSGATPPTGASGWRSTRPSGCSIASPRGLRSSSTRSHGSAVD